MDQNVTRGERNHNPTNINWIPPSRAWNGQIGIEAVPPGAHYSARFGNYVDDFHGLRAGAKELLKDFAHVIAKKGACSILDLTEIWAPEADPDDPRNLNHPESYAKEVALFVGIEPKKPLQIAADGILPALLTGFVTQENGRCHYPPELIAAVCRDAIASSAFNHVGDVHV